MTNQEAARDALGRGDNPHRQGPRLRREQGGRMGTSTSRVLLLASWIAWCLPAEAQPLFVPAPGSPIAVAGSPQNIVSGDLDGDGKLDLITAENGRSVTVLLGDGRGGFHPAPSSPTGLPISPGEMAAGDVDG